MLHAFLRIEYGGSSMKQILLIQLARFGDLVQTGRLIQSLQAYGQVHICLDSSLEALAACLYPKALLHPIPAHGNVFQGNHTAHMHAVHDVFARLQACHFDAVYNLNYSPLNTSLVRLFAPEIVHGYAVEQGQIVRSLWSKKAFRWTQNRHISPLNLVDFWAYFTPQPCTPTMVNPQALGQGRGVGVVLAGRESRRSLPAQVLVPVVRTFFEALDGPPLYLLGSAAEIPLARQVRKLLPAMMQDKVQDYCGKTSWQDLVDAVQGLDALISPDTGTMHLAARLGVPVHAFFLSSAWCHETGPYGQGHTVWQSGYHCAPCLESAPCPVNTACLQDFTHPHFYRALTAHIQKRNLGPGKELPSSLSCQTSYVDALGSAFTTHLGVDVHAERRQMLRVVLAEYCQCPLEEGNTLDESMTQYFYEEADWMLRQRKSFSTLVAREIK